MEQLFPIMQLLEEDILHQKKGIYYPYINILYVPMPDVIYRKKRKDKLFLTRTVIRITRTNTSLMEQKTNQEVRHLAGVEGIDEVRW